MRSVKWCYYQWSYMTTHPRFRDASLFNIVLGPGPLMKKVCEDIHNMARGYAYAKIE